jgi:hypothetical protein
MHLRRYNIANVTGALAVLCLLMPTQASALGAQVEHLGGDHYRVWACISGNLATKAQLQESGRTLQTLRLELVVTENPHYHGQNFNSASSTIDVTVPADVEEISVLCGTESKTLDLHKHALDPDTEQIIRRAIDHGDALQFSYQNEKVVAFPRQLYRVSGDTHGAIVQCVAQAKGDSQQTRRFYIRSISDVAVKDVSRLDHPQ